MAKKTLPMEMIPRVTKDHLQTLESAAHEVNKTERGLEERARRRAELRSKASSKSDDPLLAFK